MVAMQSLYIHTFYMRIFRQKPTENFNNEMSFLDPKNIVTSFRQRLHEDPDFKEGFTEALINAKAGAEAQALAESKDNADEYSCSDFDLPDKVHEARAGAFKDILHLLEGFLLSDNPFDPEEFTSELRRSVGLLAAEAYFQGQLETPPMLKTPGSLGYLDSEYGLIVAWDRVKDMDTSLMLDGATDAFRAANPDL